MIDIPIKFEDQAGIQQAVTILKAYGAEAVYLFGSRAAGAANSASDWDIGVEGLPPESFFPALGKLNDAMHCKIDLVELDDGSRFSEFIKKWEKIVRVA